MPVCGTLARVGDIPLGIGRAADPVLRVAMQRSRAWGLSTLLVGAGPPPEPGAPDFVLWVGTDEIAARYSGQVVFVYRLLWEPTHVALEHPGLLLGDEECSRPVCVTCADERGVKAIGRELAADAACLASAFGRAVSRPCAAPMECAKAGDRLARGRGGSAIGSAMPSPASDRALDAPAAGAPARDVASARGEDWARSGLKPVSPWRRSAVVPLLQPCFGLAPRLGRARVARSQQGDGRCSTSTAGARCRDRPAPARRPTSRPRAPRRHAR